VARGQTVPNGESSMWGDYHGRELALMILREIRREPYLVFFDSIHEQKHQYQHPAND
jgi:unsaturated chondroitin disaccharide hydrolase